MTRVLTRVITRVATRVEQHLTTKKIFIEYQYVEHSHFHARSRTVGDDNDDYDATPTVQRMTMDGAGVGSDDTPSFTDLPWVLQEKILSQLEWTDIGASACACRAWRDYFRAGKDAAVVRSTNTTCAP